MDSKDRLLLPCLFVSLAINGAGVIVVANTSVFDPSRRPPPPPVVAEARRYTEIRREPTPTPPPTPRPVVPTPTPAPTPTPTPGARTQAVTSTPKPNQPVPRHDAPLVNLGPGHAGTQGDIPINANEVKSDLAVGTKANRTQNVVAPIKQTPEPTPTPTPAPAAPAPTPIPRSTPAPAAPVVHHAAISSEPAIPLSGWDSITGSISVGDDFDPSQLRRNSVVVSIDTDANGEVKNVSVTLSCGVSTIDDQIRKNCYKQRYKPPTEDGVALPAHFEHTFNLSF